MKSQSEATPSEAQSIVTTLHSTADGGRILQLHLNRPNKRNALTLAMLEELRRGLVEPVSRIVLTSSGPSFCAGLDLDESREHPTWPRPMSHLELLAGVYRGLLNTPAKIVAFLQGFAVGGGVGLAACADVVVAMSDARLRLPQGELAALARIVQPIVEARQMARRGTTIWQAGELDAGAAQAVGLVDEIVDPAAFATHRAQALGEFLAPPAQPPSWRQPERCRKIEQAMRTILTELSR